MWHNIIHTWMCRINISTSRYCTSRKHVLLLNYYAVRLLDAPVFSNAVCYITTSNSNSSQVYTLLILQTNLATDFLSSKFIFHSNL